MHCDLSHQQLVFPLEHKNVVPSLGTQLGGERRQGVAEIAWD